MVYTWVEGTGPGFEDARIVRRKVFVEEQGYSLIGEFDEQDKTSWHVIGYEQEKPLCTARMFTEAASGVYHVGRVAVVPECRGKGIGLFLMQEVAQKAKTMGAKRLVLNAQQDKALFYKRAGYRLTGEEMLDEGQPHVGMEQVFT